jgi:hypothetical protein
MEAAVDARALKTEPGVAAFVTYPIPDSNCTVRLNLDVIDHLGRDVMEGFKAMPRHGLEVGGLLLGRVDGDCVAVEDYEPLPCEHERGPSFVLSARDRKLLAETVAGLHAEDGLRVVGLYRSQTRPGMACAPEDTALVEELCRDGVFLLVKPEAGHPSAAALFSGDGPRVKPAEFPFHRGSPLAGGYTVVEAPVTVRAPTPVTPEPAPLDRAPRLTTIKVMEGLARQLEQSRHNNTPEVPPPIRVRRAAGMIWSAVILAFAGVAGYAVARWWTTRPTPTPPAPGSMALNLTLTGGSLHLRWDRGSPVIRNASRAVIWIGDGAAHQRLDLNPRELTDGSIQYWPSSPNVDFKLEVFTGNDSASESVRAINIPLSAAPAGTPEPEAQSRSDATSLTYSAPRPFAAVGMEVLPPSSLRRLASKKPIAGSHLQFPTMPPEPPA